MNQPSIPAGRPSLYAVTAAVITAFSFAAAAQTQPRNYPNVGPHSSVQSGTGAEAPAGAPGGTGAGSGTATSDPCRGMRGEEHAQCMRKDDQASQSRQNSSGPSVQRPSTDGHPPKGSQSR